MYIVFKETPIHQKGKTYYNQYYGERWGYYHNWIKNDPAIVGNTHMHIFICQSYKDDKSVYRQRYIKRVYDYFPLWLKSRERKITTTWLIYHHIKRAAKEAGATDQEISQMLKCASKYVRPLNKIQREHIKTYATTHNNKIRESDIII